MPGLDNLVDNQLTNNPAVQKATLLLTENPIVIGSEFVRSYNTQNIKVVRANKTDYQISQLTTQDKEYYKSTLGTPVLTDLVFSKSTYTDENGTQFQYGDITLVTVLISIQQTKNIVKTAIQGRPGTIKEYIGLGDYIITINGVITGPNGHYPREEVTALKTMLTNNRSLEVVAWYLQLWGINYVTIDDFNINQEEGGYSYQPFTINCSSDTDVNLRLV